MNLTHTKVKRVWSLKQLGLDPASPLVNKKLVKAAFQIRALNIHPDKNQVSSSGASAATAAMTDLNNAYDFLKTVMKD